MLPKIVFKLVDYYFLAVFLTLTKCGLTIK
jgi:hypothetical protein